MPAFAPKQRTQIYAEMSANLLALAPITSTELGEVSDNIIFSTADQIYDAYEEAVNALALLNLDNTTGDELDKKASEFPDLPARFEAVRATGFVTVTDPAITKISSEVALGGSQAGDNFLNVDNASLFPANGTVLIGFRGTSSFETFQYTSKSGNQLQSTTDFIDFDHGSDEPVVKTTVGDRLFPGPFNLQADATPTVPAKSYTSTAALTIYDGEENGTMAIQSNIVGPEGNTPSNTIKKFVGAAPFVGAQVSNLAPLNNGQAREKDPDLRARIRAQQQALSTGNIDAVTAALYNANFQGQQIKFVQVVEDPDPTLPSIAYIDDGAGFAATVVNVTDPILLVDAALGGERRFYIPSQYRPIVTTDLENSNYVFANISLEKNGNLMTQGTGPLQYQVQPDRGIIRLNTPLDPGDKLEIVAITHYAGLLQEANYELYGKREDRENYPGISALGTWIQARTPAVQFVSVQGDVVLDTTRPLNDVVAEIKQNIIQYINSLGIGSTVVRNRLVALGFVKGVKNFTLILPVSDVIIPDGTLAKTTLGNITVS